MHVLVFEKQWGLKFWDFFLMVHFTFFKRFYLFSKRGREGEKHQCVVDSRTPWWYTHNPGMCPGLGVELTLWFTGQCSIH